MEKQETLHTLQGNVRAAKQQLDAATEQFDGVIQKSPGASPHPDGVQRIHNAAKALNHARGEHVQAHVRLKAFVAEGMIPDNLKESAVRKEELGRVKIQRSGE